MPYEDALAGVVSKLAALRERESAPPSRFARTSVDIAASSGLLGLTVSGAHGGGGGGIADAATVVARLAQECASTATILQAHYAATSVLSRYGPAAVLEDIGAGKHLGTLALTEDGGQADWFGSGTRAPHAHGEVVDLSGCKSWVPAAGEADSYLWSSGSLSGGAGDGTSLWFVPANAPGLHVPACATGNGLRGLGAAPVTGDPVQAPVQNLLGADGQGRELVHESVLPWYTLLGAAVSLGIIRSTVELVAGCSRSAVESLRVRADSVQALFEDALAAIQGERADAVAASWAVRAVAMSTAVAVTEHAAEFMAEGRADEATHGAVEQRLRDAHAASSNPPRIDTGLSHIARGLWLAVPQAGSARKLAFAGARS